METTLVPAHHHALSRHSDRVRAAHVALHGTVHLAFGGSPSKADRERFAASAQYTGGKFHNSLPTTMDLSPGDTRACWKFFRPDPGREPAHKLKGAAPDPVLVARPAAVPRSPGSAIRPSCCSWTA